MGSFQKENDRLNLISNYIINRINSYNKNKSDDEKIRFNVNRLQAILFICDVEYMKISEGKSLFTEDYYAFPVGPAIERVYDEYSNLEPKQINNKAPLTFKIINIINAVLDETADLSNLDLNYFVSCNNESWIRNYYKYSIGKSIIPKEEIYELYKNKDMDIESLKVKELNRR